MPQMGESITEGTISKWLKNVGDFVQQDEPILEISTDKVDAEIPSPTSGRLVGIRHLEGETVPINQVIATIETDSEAVQKREPLPESSELSTKTEGGSSLDVPPSVRDTVGTNEIKTTHHRGFRSSPLVRKMAKEHGLDISRITGTGLGGRVTKRDVLTYLETKPTPMSAQQEPGGRGTDATPSAVVVSSEPVVLVTADQTLIEPMSVMRKKIAEHMILSRRTSAHVTTVFEIEMTKVSRLREQYKGGVFERDGLRLTYLPFIAKACIDALKTYPILNASVVGDTILYKKDINIGIAVALGDGLIVPVIKKADEKSILGLARTIRDLADRARKKQLKPEEVQNGTFTITNPGVFGSLFGTPIINQPQVAILGVGKISKRPVVVDDAIAIRTMAYFSLSFDHRIIDGAVADQFMSEIKRRLENFELVGG
jgi:2-oxoglutarate dehydrogenase E2 component (dihydrolipoamide succinyltransferase)